MSRTARTISVLEGDWERWTRTAGERGIADRGRAYSVSEFVRRAVEACLCTSHTPSAMPFSGSPWESPAAQSSGLESEDEQEARTNGGATALGRNRAAAGGESQPRRKADSGRHLAERPITSGAETGGAVSHTRLIEAYQHGNHAGGTEPAVPARAQARSERHGEDCRKDRETERATGGLGRTARGRTVAADTVAGAVKREAKAPHQRASDPAAPPSRRPFTKEAQTRRPRKA